MLQQYALNIEQKRWHQSSMLATAWGFKFKKKEGKFKGEICILQMNVLINAHLTKINFEVFKEGLLKNLKYYKKKSFTVRNSNETNIW